MSEPGTGGASDDWQAERRTAGGFPAGTAVGAELAEGADRYGVTGVNVRDGASSQIVAGCPVTGDIRPPVSGQSADGGHRGRWSGLPRPGRPARVGIGGAARPRWRPVTGRATLALLCALLAPLWLVPGAAAEEGDAADRGPDPIDFAIVVDQSASLSKADLAREVEAADLLSQGEISERSRAAVIGFGSAEKEGQSAVNEVCDLTVVDAAGRQKLSDCVRQLSSPDRERIGPGTDFPAALRQAVDRLTRDAGPDVPKVVFLLTDGRLDVRDSPSYGAEDDPAARQAQGETDLAEILATARQESVQVWPLGFGDEIDQESLRHMAEGGYRNGCADLPEARPRMRIVKDSSDIGEALQQTFAAARCAQVEQGTTGTPPTDLYVEIPPIATDGSITVTKGDPRVTTTYYDPQGRKVPTSGAAFDSSFELSGQDGLVEALRVRNPLPGKWRVHLEAPPDHQGQEASLRAIWQGRLRSSVVMDPVSPQPGETVTVEARLQTRSGVQISESHHLEKLTVTAQLTGDGFAPQTLELTDDGEGADARAGDVQFTGRLAIPDGATDKLTLIAEMAAPGVAGDARPLHTRVTVGAPLLTAKATVDDHTVHPGGSVPGTVAVTNNDSREHTLRLGLADHSGTTGVRIEPSTVRVPAGSSEPLDFTLSLAEDAPLGAVPGQITVVDTTDGDRLVGSSHLNVRVEAEPTWWDHWWWAVLGAAALLLVAVALVWIRLVALGRGRNPTGLEVELLRDGRLVDKLTVRNATSGGFHFRVESPHGNRPALRRSTGGGGASYSLKRLGTGEVRIRPPRGPERTLRPNESLSVGNELELVVRDRRAASRTSRPGPGAGPGPAGGAPPPRRPSGSDGSPGSRRWPGGRGAEPPGRTPAGPGEPTGPASPSASARRHDPNF